MILSDIVPYLVAAFIILMNIVLWSSIRKKKPGSFWETWTRAGKSLQKPWEKEDRKYRQLSALVEKFKQQKTGTQPEQESDSVEKNID
jgi:hypothetical protein